MRVTRILPALALTSLIALAGANPSFAAVNPGRSGYDSRVQHVDFNPENIVNLKTATDVMTTIIFAPGEQAVNFGSGFTNAWQMAARENYFFLRPIDKSGATNVTIATNRGRIYQFDVRIVPKNQATYSLSFSYPSDELALTNAQREKAEIMHRLNRNPGLGGYDVSADGTRTIYTPPAERNYEYTMNFGDDPGSYDLAPTRVYDDGRFTYFNFKPQAREPRIFTKNPDGSENLASFYKQEDGTLVVMHVAPAFSLRIDKAVVGVYNEHYEAYMQSGSPLPDDHGTTVSGLKRVDK